MVSIARSAIVPYSAGEMYALVSGIEAYPVFLPWCRATRILHRDEDEVKATIHVSKRGINLAFTTRNLMQQNKMIELRLLEGPFHRLQGFWHFEPLNELACKVSLDMEFEISNRILRLTVSPIFHQITNSLVDAFVRRAREVYGRR